MPVYQYACPDCGHKFELKQKFTDDPVKKCPNCERRHVYRVVGQVAISFKGSGWYITDSKSSSDKKTLEHRPKEKVEGAAANGNGTAEGAKNESAKSDGSKNEGAKGEGAKSDSAASESTKKAEVETKTVVKESGDKSAGKSAAEKK